MQNLIDKKLSSKGQEIIFSYFRIT